MKAALIYALVVTVLLIISIIVCNLMLKSKDKKHEKEIEEVKKDYEQKISDLKKLEAEKDKLKVEADEKKRKIRTGNSYDNLVNGAEQLCVKA